MSDTLNATEIDAASDRTRDRVEIPEWGGHAFIEEWDDETRDAWEQYVLSTRETQPGIPGLRRRAVLLGLVNENGQRVFDAATGDKILRKKSATVINRLFDLIQKKNRLGPEAVVEEKKDSSPTTTSDSSTV